MHDRFLPQESFENVDRLLHAFQARLTAGISYTALTGAFVDWGLHLANAPGRQALLANQAAEDAARLAAFAANAGGSGAVPPFADGTPPRFPSPDWDPWPYSVYAQTFLAWERWWARATDDVRGVSAQHLRVVDFVMRQRIDRLSPAN